MNRLLKVKDRTFMTAYAVHFRRYSTLEIVVMKQQAFSVAEPAILIVLICLTIVVVAIPTTHRARQPSKPRSSDISTFFALAGIVTLVIALVLHLLTSLWEYRRSRRLTFRERCIKAKRLSYLLPKLVITLMVSAVMLARVALDKHGACKACVLNSDIGGIGVLIGIYSPVVAISFSLILGHYTSKETGTKELGSVVLMNVAYLTFNLMKAFSNLTDLSYVDKLVVFIFMDASNMTLTMTRCSKDCLAARLYIGLCNHFQGICIIVQSIGFIISSMHWADQNNCCYKQIWWASISDCNLPDATLWLYAVLINLLWLDVSRKSHRYSPAFDAWKKETQQISDDNLEDFDAIRTTVFFDYLFKIPLLLVNVVSLVAALVRQDVERGSKWSDWGQSAQLVSSVFGLMHWLYVLLKARKFRKSMVHHGDEDRGLDPDDDGRIADEDAKKESSKQKYQRRFAALGKTLQKLILIPVPHDAEVDDATKKIFKKSQISLGKASNILQINQELHDCAKMGDIRGISEMLKYGADINSKFDKDGETWTPLCRTVYEDHMEAFQFLLEQGAAPHLPPEPPEEDDTSAMVEHSALHYAAMNGKERFIRALMPQYLRNADLFDAVTYVRPLECAVKNNHVEAAAALLDNKAEVDGHTELLLVATKYDNVRMMELLCSRGADVDGPSTTLPERGTRFGFLPLMSQKLALDIAIDQNNTDRIAVLKQYKAITYAQRQPFDKKLHDGVKSGDEASVTEALSEGARINSVLRTNGEEMTPACLAVEYNHITTLQISLGRGAGSKFYPSDQFGHQDRSCRFSALHSAARKGVVEAIEVLVPDYTTSTYSYDEQLMRPLIYAVEGGHLDAARCLLTKRASANDATKIRHKSELYNGMSCLMTAIEQDNFGMMELLCGQYSANPNAVGFRSLDEEKPVAEQMDQAISALDIALGCNNDASIKFLRDRGARTAKEILQTEEDPASAKALRTTLSLPEYI